MVDPGIKIDRNYWVYKEGREQGVFCTYPDGSPFVGPVWPGNCCFPDYTSPRVREWWGDLYRAMVDMGIDGFWNDMNEPAIFGHGPTTMANTVQHDWDGRGAGHREAHNVYGMQMARATVEGLRQKAELFASRAPAHPVGGSEFDDSSWMAREMTVGDDEVEIEFLREQSVRSTS